MTEVWDLKNGAVIDPETGEVIDEIVVVRRPRFFDDAQFTERVHDAPMVSPLFMARDPLAKQARELGLRHVRSEAPKLEKTMLETYRAVMNIVRENSLPVDGETVAKIIRTAAETIKELYGVTGSHVALALMPVALWTLSAITQYPLCKKYRKACKFGGRIGPTIIAGAVLKKLGLRTDPRKIGYIWIERLCTAFNVFRLIPFARWIFDRTTTDTSPRLEAAGAVYAAGYFADIRVTMKGLAEALEVSTSTISKWCRRTIQRLGCDHDSGVITCRDEVLEEIKSAVEKLVLHG